MTEFADAVRDGNVARVKTLLEANPRLVAEPEGGVSPLLLALYSRRIEIANLLLDCGAPLSFAEACAVGASETAASLLGSDPTLLNCLTPDGFPPLALAVFFGQPALAKWLIEMGADVDTPATNLQRVAPVHAAAAVRDRDTMRLLLERGANPNARQQGDYTPLHGAASRGDVEMAKLLLRYGADRMVRDTDGLNPAEVAIKYGQNDFAAWFRREIDPAA